VLRTRHGWWCLAAAWSAARSTACWCLRKHCSHTCRSRVCAEQMCMQGASASSCEVLLQFATTHTAAHALPVLGSAFSVLMRAASAALSASSIQTFCAVSGCVLPSGTAFVRTSFYLAASRAERRGIQPICATAGYLLPSNRLPCSLHTSSSAKLRAAAALQQSRPKCNHSAHPNPHALSEVRAAWQDSSGRFPDGRQRPDCFKPHLTASNSKHAEKKVERGKLSGHAIWPG
jgi:hypothetical protein